MAKLLFIFTFFFLFFWTYYIGRSVEKCHSHMTGSHSITSHDVSHDKCGKVVHRPCSSCISSAENLIETLSSSSYQILIKEQLA